MQQNRRNISILSYAFDILYIDFSPVYSGLRRPFCHCRLNLYNLPISVANLPPKSPWTSCFGPSFLPGHTYTWDLA